MPKKNDNIEIAGNEYRLKQQIGSGGSGTVWTAESGDARYAVKFINSNDCSKILRFEKEVKFCSNANHRNIVKIVSEGRYNDKPYYVMHYYSATFRDIITKEKDADNLMAYILKLCKAISYIHRKKVVHRDIKPENILVEGKRLVLADFGICHFKNSRDTHSNEWLANRAYMAPEQKLKNNAHRVNQAADVYALGLIINECFTKHNPGGSAFRLIADEYPLLSSLDALVDNMIRQNETERMNVAAVESELRFIRGKYKEDFINMKSLLHDYKRPASVGRYLLNMVLKRSSVDVLIGKYLFITCSRTEIVKYNWNWHMKIGYSVDDFLFNLYIQERIFSLCKSKFEYESNIYRKACWYNGLNLDKVSEHQMLYNQMADILIKYRLPEGKILDLSGQILKYFSSCADYHCTEILNSVAEMECRAIQNLKSAPIIWIVGTLLQGVKRNIEHLIDGVNGLGGSYEFDFAEHVSIDWSRTSYYFSNDDDEAFFEKSYLEKEDLIRRVLTIAQSKWNMKSTRLNSTYYSIKFQTYRQYQKFRTYALAMAKDDYIFEGDVLEMLSTHNFVGGMVELKLSKIFEIPNTLAKVLALRSLND